MLNTFRGKLFRFIHRNNSNVVVEEDLKLHCWLSVKGPGKVEIGKDCLVAPVAGARVKMVTLYTHSPEAKITIGDNVRLIAAKISSKFAVSIGDNVIIEDASILDTDFHTLDISRRIPPDEDLETCQVVIENDVQIGSRTIITKGVALGQGCLVYPGTVVQKSFPPGSVLFGNPAKPVRKRGNPTSPHPAR